MAMEWLLAGELSASVRIDIVQNANLEDDLVTTALIIAGVADVTMDIMADEEGEITRLPAHPALQARLRQIQMPQSDPFQTTTTLKTNNCQSPGSR